MPTPPSTFAPIPQVLAALKAGQMIVLVDDENRENEGDLVAAAQFITPDIVNFMLKQARGVLCVALPPEDCDRLQLHPQSQYNTAPLGTAFTISVDAHPRFGITTGVSAAERATTIRLLRDPATQPADLSRPGHIFPLRARAGGTLERAGQTEGSVDLCKLAGLQPAAAIIEIMAEDGSMARLPQLQTFCQKHNLLLCTIADLIEFRLQREALIKRLDSLPIQTPHGPFTLRVYETLGDPLIHLALTLGTVGELDPITHLPIQHPSPILVRMHSEHLLSDVFNITGPDSHQLLHGSLKMIQQAGQGALVYLRQESRALALLDRLHELRPSFKKTIPAQNNLSPSQSTQLTHLTQLTPPPPTMDRRDFGIGAQILRDLGLTKLRLITNRPKTFHALEAFGLSVTEQVPIP